MILEYTVNKEDENKLLKVILKKKLSISNILLNRLKNGKSIFVNNQSIFVNYKLKENDKVLVDLSCANTNDISFSSKFKPTDVSISVLYEDEYLLIVEKPANMATHPSPSNYENTLSNAVITYLNKQNIHNVHVLTRLDKNTTGICIFAKNEYIQELFFRKKTSVNLIKEYICIANGILDKKHDIIEKPIARKPGSIILREVNETGDFAKTEYFVTSMNKEKNYTVLRVILHTGRTHQIRVHMASIEHVLLGDTLYAKEYNIDNIDKYISRQALHCNMVTFNHPITNEKIQIISKIPNDMEILI